jgi:biopolymer transport protein ExbB
MAGPERSVPHVSIPQSPTPQSLHGQFTGWLFALAMLFGLAIVLGSIVAGHSQPAPEPAAAPAVSAAPPAADPANIAPPPAAPPESSGRTESSSRTEKTVADKTDTMAAGVLPHDLTPLGMFMSADTIVKAVMLGLMFASVLTWTIWLAKTLELLVARRRLRRADRLLAKAASLDDVARKANAASRHVALLIGAAENELRRSPDLHDVGGVKERIAARFGRIEAGVGRQMMRATGVIATIGATAPFVGLFGTVWGIMNSFIGISKLHTTNLAVVAPGIAEALLATACGLAAAIPAVVIYNGFARSIAHYRGLFADASVEVLALVGRDLTRPGPGTEEKRAEEKRTLAAVSGGAAR